MTIKNIEEFIDVTTLDPVDRIQILLSSMSKKQAKAASYIMNAKEIVPYQTLAELSASCGVSEASIVRLAGTLGYDGYSHLQRELRNSLKKELSISKRLELTEQLGTDSDSIMEEVFQKGIEGLRRTIGAIRQDFFKKAVDLLSGAKRVFMFGSRSSLYLVEFFALELRWIRNDVYALSTQSSAFDAMSDLREGDVFFAISMPHYLRSTVRAVQLANQKGIPTIAITDSLSSPLIPYTAVPLVVDNEIYSYCDNALPVLAVITALLNAVGHATRPKSNEILKKNEESWKHFDLYLG